jgi:hypothetical protein
MSVIQSGERFLVPLFPALEAGRSGPEKKWDETRCDLNIAYPEPASGKT